MVWRCLALATLLTLGGLGVQGVQLQSSLTRLAKAQKEEAHAALFEKDFTVELDMVAAHERNLNLGVQLDTDTDFTPVSVARVRKNGLMETWNKAHPDRAILVGDQIMKVNDILWHHNSQMFAERIKNQYKAYKEYKPGAKKVLTLALQRPRHEKEVRYQSQREDLHRQMYSKEFTVDIPFVQNNTIGWTLNASVDWNPVSVASLSSTGLVALWNQDNPEKRIYPGDEIIMANNINWHHNTKVFKNRIDTMLHRTTKQAKSKVAITMRIQRPRSVAQVLEGKTFQKMFDVTLPSIGPKEIGWTLQTDTSDPINITGISDGGFLSLWNKGIPEQSLAVGDRIIKANSVNWHHNKTNFASNLLKLLSTRRNTTLRVQRQVQFNYARGWTVEIPARVNQLLGLQLNASDDEFPVTVNLIRRLSAASIFNEDNPDDAMMPGDQIFKVNDVLWRGNSREFAQRLEREFATSKRTGVMRLWVQRPEGLQTEDESNVDYMEFSTELNVSSPKAMGWELNTSGAGPVSIGKLLNHGSISSWNENNPLKDVQAGDQLIQVDNNIWHNNTEIFMKHLGHQLADAAGGKGKWSIAVLFRRPYEVTTDDDSEGNDEELGGDVMGAEE
jgi:hypothetical protein